MRTSTLIAIALAALALATGLVLHLFSGQAPDLVRMIHGGR